MSKVRRNGSGTNAPKPSTNKSAVLAIMHSKEGKAAIKAVIEEHMEEILQSLLNDSDEEDDECLNVISAQEPRKPKILSPAQTRKAEKLGGTSAIRVD